MRTSLTPDPREARPPQSGRAGARERHGGCGTALSSRAPANAVTPAAANGLQRPALQPRRRRRSAGEPQRPLAARVRPRAESERLSVEFSERLREPRGAGRLWRRRRGPKARLPPSRGAPLWAVGLGPRKPRFYCWVKIERSQTALQAARLGLWPSGTCWDAVSWVWQCRQ